MTDLIKIAVDAMGGDGSPKKIIDGIVLNHQNNKELFYKIFGNGEQYRQYRWRMFLWLSIPPDQTVWQRNPFLKYV